MAERASVDFCPYVGLQPFTARDRQYFFGREREQRVIVANLFAAPLTVLFGPSAVGKSSVLQAGVVPRLAAEPRTVVVYFASWPGEGYRAAFKKDCRAAIEAVRGQSLDVDDRLPLDDWIVSARAQFRGVLLMILDQFEEYLLYHAEQDATAFDEELARTVNRSEVGANLLIGLRDDSLSKLNRLSKRIPNLMGNTLELRRLTPEAARHAITGPVAEYNRQFPSERPVRIEDTLVERILDEVRSEKVAPSLSGGLAGLAAGADRNLVETAFLQLVLIELWREATARAGERVMTTATLEALGGPKAIVRRHVDLELGRLSRDAREVAARLFQHLVTPSGAKYALRTDDLVEIAGRPRGRVVPVLTALSAARLLRRIDPPERYEIFHDAFAVAMLDWRKEYVQRQRLRTVAVAAIAAAVALAAVVGTIVYVVHQRRDASESRLNLQVATLRAERATHATEAANAAQASAESAAREAALRLEAGQLQLEAARAALEGGAAKARAAQVTERANQVTAQADAARAESVRRATESKARLAQADAAQQQIAQLAVTARNEGITLLGVPNAAPTAPDNLPAPPSANSDARQPKPPANAEPSVAPPPPTTPPTVVDGRYKETYRKGVEAANEKRWRDAEALFEAAIKQNPTESTERINISGFGNVQPYVPHYFLGVAFRNLNDCSAALREWNDSERAGAIQRTNLYKSLQENRGTCTGKQ